MDALDRMLTQLALANDARLAAVLDRVLPYAMTSLASLAPTVRKLGPAAAMSLAGRLRPRSLGSASPLQRRSRGLHLRAHAPDEGPPPHYTSAPARTRLAAGGGGERKGKEEEEGDDVWGPTVEVERREKM
uniref:Uncharacterized protein n=1 Tax=Setaria viridis TaxID=4556 RepID=A0A4U6VTQ9_SETVI|nr:hypothetical protein SEVIR_2G225200v2 [Setaria viridis]